MKICLSACPNDCGTFILADLPLSTLFACPALDAVLALHFFGDHTPFS